MEPAIETSNYFNLVVKTLELLSSLTKALLKFLKPLFWVKNAYTLRGTMTKIAFFQSKPF